jgi:uncharacterized membrane protein
MDAGSSAWLGGSHIFKSLPASPLPDETTGTKETRRLQKAQAETGAADLGLGQIRATGRPAFWRVSMNDVNAVSPLPEYSNMGGSSGEFD